MHLLIIIIFLTVDYHYFLISCGEEITPAHCVALALCFRDSSWFNETWLGRIKDENGANWRLKVRDEQPRFQQARRRRSEGLQLAVHSDVFSDRRLVCCFPR